MGIGEGACVQGGGQGDGNRGRRVCAGGGHGVGIVEGACVQGGGQGDGDRGRCVCAGGVRKRRTLGAMSAACEKNHQSLINLHYLLQKLVHLQFVESSFFINSFLLIKSNWMRHHKGINSNSSSRRISFL